MYTIFFPKLKFIHYYTSFKQYILQPLHRFSFYGFIFKPPVSLNAIILFKGSRKKYFSSVPLL